METAEISTVSDLAALLSDQLRKVWALAPDRPAGRQELTCAADVAGALAEVAPAADQSGPARGFMPQPASALISIPVIISPDSAPGTWRLVTHGGCEVRGEHPDSWVSHERCTAAGGRLMAGAACDSSSASG
jgi:hypothetical protein